MMAVESNSTLDSIAECVKAGDASSLGRAITLVEDSPEMSASLFGRLGRPAFDAMRLGITGPPGVGKSTLISMLIPHILSTGRTDERLGVIMVDPTSPVSGGALLGDRVRLGKECSSSKVFVRSLASRGSLGGVSAAAGAAARLMEHWGAGVVLIETVGAGQTGTDLAGLVDVVFLVLAPGAGDGIQTLKAGILELADAYIINKCDLPGADGLEMLLNTVPAPARGSLPEIVKCSAREGEGIGEAWDLFIGLRKKLIESVGKKEMQLRRIAREITILAEDFLLSRIHSVAAREVIEEYARGVIAGSTDVYTAARGLLDDSLRNNT